MQLQPGASSEPRIAFDISEEVVVADGVDEQVVVLRAGGEIDFAAGPHLRARLFAHIDTGCRRLILDLSAVTFIDSMAIGVLVGAVMRLQETAGGSLVAVCSSSNERVLRIFDIAGVASLIALHRTQADALAALAGMPLGRARPSTAGGSSVAREPIGSHENAKLDITQRYATVATRPSQGEGGRDRRGCGVDELA